MISVRGKPVRAIDFDDPTYTKEQMNPPPKARAPTEEEITSLLNILRKQVAYQRVDLYAEPVYGRSLEVELWIVEDWQRARCPVKSANASDSPA